MNKRIQLIILLALMPLAGLKAQEKTTVITNVTLHLGTGKVIEKGILAFERGKIVDVGETMTQLYKDAVVIDGTGKHLYPGLVCLNSIMGLNEIDAVRATHDYSENGMFNPNVRSLIAYNTDSKILSTAMVTGILYTQPVPQGGVLSGSSSMMRIQGWNWEDAALLADDGVHLNWPRLPQMEDKESKAEKIIRQTEAFFADADAYCRTEQPVFNARLEAIRNVLNGKCNLYVHAQDARSMVRSITFFRQRYPAIHLVLVGAVEAWLIKDFIKEQNVPVVLGNLHRLPSTPAEDIDQPYRTPAELQAAGITIALSHEGSWESRNLAYTAGTAAAYGMGKEEALKAITLTPAQLAGVGDQIGSLEKGKAASFLLTGGDLLDMKSSAIQRAWLDGNELNLKNEQEKLSEKYLRKYKLISE